MISMETPFLSFAQDGPVSSDNILCHTFFDCGIEHGKVSSWFGCLWRSMALLACCMSLLACCMEFEWVYLLHVSSLNIIQCFREDIRYVESVNTLCSNFCGIFSGPSCTVSQRMIAINMYWKNSNVLCESFMPERNIYKSICWLSFWWFEIDHIQWNELDMQEFHFLKLSTVVA